MALKAAYLNIGFGETSIDNTLGQMKFLVKQASRDYVVIQKAREIIASNPSDRFIECETVYEWVKNNIRFTRDPHKTEMIQSPEYLLYDIARNKIGFGDCDDMTVLGSSLMKAIGIPVGFRAISTMGDELHHVYGLAHINSEWIPWDASNANLTLGQEPFYTRKKDVYIF